MQISRDLILVIGVDKIVKISRLRLVGVSHGILVRSKITFSIVYMKNVVLRIKSTRLVSISALFIVCPVYSNKYDHQSSEVQCCLINFVLNCFEFLREA